MTSVIERPAPAIEAEPANRPPPTTVERVVQPMPDRYRNPIGRYKVRRSADCRSCAVCVDICPYGVHVKPPGYNLPLRPRDYLCIGPKCAETDHYCVEHCPNKALSVGRNPTADAIGDPRWTSDLLLATWRQAETGTVASVGDLEYRRGASGGGFDALRFRFPESPATVAPEEVDTRLELNRRDDGRPHITIDLPIYGGGMSFGSVSIHVMIAKARAATAWNTFTCTGEGGYPDRLQPYDDHVMTQVATGLFGVREETIQRVRIVEFKYAQGAKPDSGATSSVTRIRRTWRGCDRPSRVTPCSHRSRSTASTRSRTTRSTSTGSKR